MRVLPSLCCQPREEESQSIWFYKMKKHSGEKKNPQQQQKPTHAQNPKPKCQQPPPAATHTQKISISEQKLNQRRGCFPAGDELAQARNAATQRHGVFRDLEPLSIILLFARENRLFGGTRQCCPKGERALFCDERKNHQQETGDYWQRPSRLGSPHGAPWKQRRSMRIVPRALWDPKQRPLPVPSTPQRSAGTGHLPHWTRRSRCKPWPPAC